MYFTYVVRPGEAPEGRGPSFAPVWETFSCYALRVGFFLQFVAYSILMSLCTLGEHSVAPGTADPSSPKTSSVSPAPLHHGTPKLLIGFFHDNSDSQSGHDFWIVMLALSLWLGGLFMVHLFTNTMDDDGSIKQTRGFRAGIKAMSHGVTLGIIGWLLTLVAYYANVYYFDSMWLKKELGSGSCWLIFFAGRLFDALSLIFIAAAVYCLELFHVNGAGELWGWIVSGLFKLTAIIEFFGLIMFGSDSFAVIDLLYSSFLGTAILLCFIWSLFFEPVVHRYDVKLTQSAMRNEYYKSRNAMAYYGPAVVTADGQIDVTAAAEHVADQHGCCG